jgi:hypothetical protein
MGSGVLIMTGTFDPKTKTLHLAGTQTDPMTGSDIPFREDIEFPDDDTHVMTMYGPGMDGKEMKMMEIRLKKVK